MKVIICAGLAGTSIKGGPSDCEGSYLKSYNPEAHDGRGEVIWTTDIDDAIKFEDAMEAFKCWNQIPANNPVRPDGKPNKPMTAFSITIEEAPDK